MKLEVEKLKSLINEVIAEENIMEMATFNTAMQKINRDMIPFFILSASRSERGSKYSSGNTSASKDLETFLRNNNLSFTKVDGGYTEFQKQLDADGNVEKDDAGEDVYAQDAQGNKIPQTVEEVSYLVFGDDPHYGEEENRVKNVLELFEIAKAACLIDPNNPQEAFTFGYPIHDEHGGDTDMFIALYRPTAERPGKRHIFKDWGGPYMDAEHFPSSAQGPYTAVRKGRINFTEQKLKEAKLRKVNSVNEGRKKHADIARLEKQLLFLKGIK
jgi:hypothetical protein